MADRRKCIECGKPNPYSGTRERCVDCHRSYKESKRAKYYCKMCGDEHGKSSTAFCKECYIKYQEEKWQTKECVKCGKEVTRYRNYFERHPITFCGLDCQRVYALHENHSGKNKRKENGSAKREWRKQRSDERKAVSIGYQWWRKCKRKYDIYKPLTGWDRRCNTVPGSVSTRHARKTKPHKQKECQTWEKAARTRNISAASRMKRLMQQSSTWTRKCDSVAKNSQRRSKRKLARRREKESGRIGKPERQLMLFDFLD